MAENEFLRPLLDKVLSGKEASVKEFNYKVSKTEFASKKRKKNHFPCDYCDNSFPSITAIKKHIASSHIVALVAAKLTPQTVITSPSSSPPAKKEKAAQEVKEAGQQGLEPRRETGQEPSEKAGQEAKQEHRQQDRQGVGQEARQGAGQDARQVARHGPGQLAGQGAGQEIRQEARQEAGQGVRQEAVQGAGQEAKLGARQGCSPSRS